MSATTSTASESIREGSSHAYRRLHEQCSLAQLLEQAMRFEKNAATFFRSLEGKVDSQVAPLVRELAEEEELHYQQFLSLSQDPLLADLLNVEIPLPPINDTFNAFSESPTLGDCPSEQEILCYAIHREQAAMVQYLSLAEEVPPGPARTLLHYLGKEELSHKFKLEIRYHQRQRQH